MHIMHAEDDILMLGTGLQAAAAASAAASIDPRPSVVEPRAISDRISASVADPASKMRGFLTPRGASDSSAAPLLRGAGGVGGSRLAAADSQILLYRVGERDATSVLQSFAMGQQHCHTRGCAATQQQQQQQQQCVDVNAPSYYYQDGCTHMRNTATHGRCTHSSMRDAATAAALTDVSTVRYDEPTGTLLTAGTDGTVFVWYASSE